MSLIGYKYVRWYQWIGSMQATIMDSFAFLGRSSIHMGPTPPLTPQTMLDACIQNCLQVSTLYRVGGGRTARKFLERRTLLRGSREMTEKYKYCSTVPRTCPGLQVPSPPQAQPKTPLVVVTARDCKKEK